MSLIDLFSTFNVTAHKETIERKYTDQIATLTKELEPYERSRNQMIKAADWRAQSIGWLGLVFMGLQTGVLARLTWFEYSWDIMEPVTYFVTYVTGMFFYAYYMVTRQVFG
ncbi:calcium uniporter protein, mitochondrial-like [Octopus sinensis]|uniref:Calcium uniporter protein n=1 Tax=Octopus sinensis TaxID=2607531 RepID=A0A7E6EIH7_9MOLL|nr:calcium uniporter protein, mitochondrial-like [Octopus sinensis]XP_036355511.1 calcium uniporter protein, mitochondrial-like [Octopus sinensis]XP_036355512.1 calcium uniporter protein, mitochondrial-like [Octopus sinensis]XP_036355863.1 calcium uniporter protein, mitochondrial-like [Octopus sinensis]